MRWFVRWSIWHLESFFGHSFCGVGKRKLPAPDPKVDRKGHPYYIRCDAVHRTRSVVGGADRGGVTLAVNLGGFGAGGDLGSGADSPSLHPYVGAHGWALMPIHFK